MSNKRITDLPNSTRLIGTEALILDQESSIAVTGIDTVQTTLSSIQEFTLSAAPFINVIGLAEFEGPADFYARVTMPGVTAVSTSFEIDSELSVDGPSEFLDDVEMAGDLQVDGAILSADDIPYTEIFAFKGQYIQNGGGVEFIQRLTQAQYDAIGIPDPTILYIIVG